MLKILYRLNSEKIEQFYYRATTFLILSIFLLSILGIWWRFDITVVSFVLVISVIASYFTSGSDIFKSNNDFVLVALLIFLLQCSSTFLVSFIPTFTYDEVAYSVSLPKHYVAAHKFYYVDNYGPYSAFPQNFETITSVSLLFFDSPFLAKVINYILGFGMVLAANRMAIQCGVSKKTSILAGLFVGCSISLITSLPIAKNDILNSFFQVWTIVFLIEYFIQKRIIFAVIIGVLLGSAIGTKYNSLIFSIVPIGFFLAITHLSSMPYKDKLQRYVGLFLFLLLAAFPWYLRNALEFHNPVYPVANQFFLGMNLYNQTYINVFNEIFYDDIVDFSWASGTILVFLKKHIHGLGAVVSLFGFLGLCLGLTSKNEARFLSLTLIALSIITLRFGFWEPRYNLTLLIVISVFAVFFFDKALEFIQSKSPSFNTNVATNIMVVVFCMIGFFSGFKIYHSIEYEFLVNRPQFLALNVPYWKVANFLNQNTPRYSKIGVGFGANQMFYYLDRPYYHFHPMTEKGDLLNKITPNDFITLIRNQSIDYLAISSCCSYGHTPGKTPVLSLFMKRFYEGIANLSESHMIEKVAQIDDVIIYKVMKAETK